MIIKLLAKIEYFIGRFLGLFFPARLAFERRNDWEPSSISFKEEGDRADLCVEFSSEGEFEQIRYLLEKVLKDKKRKIELIFCSESVEESVLKFQLKHKEQVRCIRLCFFNRKSIKELENWVTAPNLILVRYDFFPQLLFLGQGKKTFSLFSASVKNIRNKNILVKFLYKKIFSLFDLIVPVNKNELNWFQKDFSSKGQLLIEADLRVNQITERSLASHQTLSDRFSWWGTLEKYLKQAKQLKVMIGNYWGDESENYGLDAISNEVKANNFILAIAPHNLSAETNQEVLSYFDKKEIEVIKISEGFTVEELAQKIDSQKSKVILFDIKGVLCELYNFFDIALVGGGYKRTTHSLLEPFVAGAKVVTGPSIHKSSEYDYIFAQDKNSIRINTGLESLNPSSWNDWVKEKSFRDIKNDASISLLLESVLSE